MARYAKRLTKEDLMRGGITNITEDGRIFKGDKEIKPSIGYAGGYLAVWIYEFDSEGNKIKVPITRKFKDHRKLTDTYNYKQRTIGLHRAMWAWHHGEVPEGYVVDHINNKHTNIEDYHISNLQLLTQKENVAKERPMSTRKLKCKLNKPRSYYEDKLSKYEAQYEAAKEAGDAELCHKLRGNISSVKARLRYWDEHKYDYKDFEEAERLEAERLAAKRQSVKDRRLLTEWKNLFKEKGNTVMWRELIRTIKAWDMLNSIQKEHVFEVLNKTFGNPWAIDV